MTRHARQSELTASPAALRSVFGENLKLLVKKAPSVSALCRELGINRTQFNRYLAGESFPRPDVLHKICDFFGVDARILLEPVEQIAPEAVPEANPADDVPNGLLSHPWLGSFTGPALCGVEEASFPSGFYRFTRAAFSDSERFVTGVIYVFRKDGFCFLRGLEPKAALEMNGVTPTIQNREFRGLVMQQAEGIAFLVNRRDALTASFNYLSRMPSIARTFWLGYAVRTTQESPSARRAARMIYEHLGYDTGKILAAARRGGYLQLEDVTPFHRQHLRFDEGFA
ncbi:hypothetical protein GCM10011415_24330 [Salipiger pallidus]|uniref:HTH cro/C1-type domain-containing protein n=1 Tax=Salipiger pallidus TaxID=1775170 RepID=A0A8J3EHJ2_9RHOB|nr:helix-turn-helix transcriptional regulator [Salipiger pallidus]GGG74933.1 hypothetical protein GCM10011415_24330 [Salipiger pallidus]